MKEFDAVVFDMDGVIFDSERATMECWEELSEKYGFGDITEPYLASVGTTSARTGEIMRKAFGEDLTMTDTQKKPQPCTMQGTTAEGFP